MTTIIPNLLTKAQCAALLLAAKKELAHFTKSEGVYRRIGQNGTKALSTYRTLKYWQFSPELKQLFNESLPDTITSQFNEAWFLYFPKQGFLDKYQSGKRLFNCLSIPLNSGGTFVIDAVEQSNNAGDGYLFSLADKHQVPKTTKADMYLCFLFSNHIQVTN
ncbi:hypothetical protein [Spartinivicinus ruber]|uniref:hypothetical protein n=1 Tax=Spartinivicinus ruber TaxID=2683272 RepID=UPI0013D15DFF|nr:hypothetical protein [Spartinivicinus ruber]